MHVTSKHWSYGFALERWHTSAFEKIISSCKTMKGLREKQNEDQGLKETYLQVYRNQGRYLKSHFSFLN